MEIDLEKVEDQFCKTCGQKKRKYVGSILGSDAVLFEPTCSCGQRDIGKRLAKSEKQIWDEISVPIWRLSGLKPKPKELQFEKYLKKRGMTYGDYRREQDYYQAKSQSAMGKFESHLKRYGKNSAPDPSFGKESH